MAFPFQLPLLLDGATGTNLIAAGMPRGVCPEQWILENPEVLKKLQADFVQAGSNAVLAPTFGANSARLSFFQHEDQAEEMNRRLAALSREAVGDGVLVGGDVSPTGLFIEPFGDATFEEVVDVYREQIGALKEAGVDFIQCETMMNLSDLRAAVLAAKECALPVFCTITVDQTGHTLSGCTLLSALIILQEMGVDAIGLNCSTGPRDMLPLFTEAARYARVPLIAKPNAGLPDAEGGDYLPPEEFAAQCAELLDAGVSIIGGCCGSTPEHIRALRKMLDSRAPLSPAEPEEFLAAARENEVFFLNDDIMPSDPIVCDYDMADALIDIEDEQVTAIRIRLSSPEDIPVFLENVHMARLPICLLADDAELLESALRLYQGRALIDSECDIADEELKRLAKTYGAMMF